MNLLIKLKCDTYIFSSFNVKLKVSSYHQVSSFNVKKKDPAKEHSSRLDLFEVRPMLDPLKTPSTARALQ